MKNNIEAPYPVESKERIELSSDQIANLGLVADSMFTGQAIIKDKIDKIRSGGKKVSAPEIFWKELDEFANGRDEVMLIFDRFRKLLNSLEIEK